MLVLIAQSALGAYGDQIQRVWGWALPNFLPTIALMVSVFASDALRPHAKDTPSVRQNFLTLSLWLSGFYLFVFAFSILIQPFLATPGEGVDRVAVRIQMLETSNLWLGPLQGLVVVALGVLFFLKEDESSLHEGE